MTAAVYSGRLKLGLKIGHSKDKMSKDAVVPRADRVPVNEEFATIEVYLSEYVTNVSRTGAFIRSKDPLPVGTRVNLKFAILGDEVEIIEGVGEVVRVQQADEPGGQGMGVIFRRLSEPSIKLLDRLCLTNGSGPSARSGAPD